jgi:DNA-binding SARP family transcriptional activator
MRLELLRPLEPGRLDRNILRLPAKSLALAAYLAVENRSVSRESLALLLWQDTQNGRHDLRNALYGIRKSLGASVVHEEGFGLRIDAECDVTEFIDAVQHNRSHKAIALYRGPFLGWLRVARSDAWDDWVSHWRDDLQAMAAESYRRVSEAELVNRVPAEGIALARRWLAVDALDERAHGTLIMSLLAAGEPVMAVRHYLKYARLMRRHLGLPPDPEITQRIIAAQSTRQMRVVKARLNKVGDDCQAALDGHTTLTRKYVRGAVTVIRQASLALESAENERRLSTPDPPIA